MKVYLWALIAMALLHTAGCASWKQNRESLEEKALEYHRMMRWQETSGASLYVVDALKPVYLEKKSSLDVIKVIDFKITHLELTNNREKATVIVEYQYQPKNSANVRTMTETQKWGFFPDANPSGWLITSPPPDFP